MIHAVDILLIFTQLTGSDLSEHYCYVQKGMKNHIRVIWTHKLFSNCPNLLVIYLTSSCVILAFFWHEWISLKLE
jgi:hypothetical protein